MRTQEAQKTLRKVAKHMRETMTPAAQLRRDFTSGRPAKADKLYLIHPVEVWNRANILLDDLRARMVAAKLKAEHVEGWLVYITAEKPFEPQHIRLLPECILEARKVFSREDAFALGVVFRQYDEEGGQNAFFVRQIQALPDQGIAVLRMGAVLLNAVTDKGVN